MSDWIITVPKTIRWEDYEKELRAARDGVYLNFRVPGPVGVEYGDRVFTVWNGRVRGWMHAVGYRYHEDGFLCIDTDVVWPPGHYVVRSGGFIRVDGPEMKGFRGIRRYEGGA